MLLTAAFFIWVRSVSAAPAYTPYAKSVKSSSAGVINPDNALGAPNNTSAQMAGLNSILTLDVGEGEEGTQSLRVYFGQINAVVNVNVDFLDSNQAVIASENRQLGADANASTQTFAYNWTSFGKAYRYVRISSTQAGAGVNLDAVEKLGFIGSTPTQDTDGDGIADRTERLNGTDPLVVNHKTNTGGGTSGATGSTGATGRTGSSGSTGATGGSLSQTGASSATPTANPSMLSRIFGGKAKLSNIGGWDWFWIILLIIAAMLSWWQAYRTKTKKPALKAKHASA